jgi:hypothetical protein
MVGRFQALSGVHFVRRVAPGAESIGCKMDLELGVVGEHACEKKL